MSGPLVKCEVNTCTHWFNGNVCSASNVDILHEEPGNMAQNPEHTECKTFEKKRGLANLVGSMDNVNWGGMISSIFMPGQQINPSVTCIVDSCKYWADGNLCHAENINVSGDGAVECQDTNCATYMNKS